MKPNKRFADLVVPSEKEPSIFSRGRWGYELLWVLIVLFLLFAPLPFLKTKKHHALDQIRNWQEQFYKIGKALLSFRGTGTYGGMVIGVGGVIQIHKGSIPRVDMTSFFPPGLPPLIQERITGEIAQFLKNFFALYPYIPDEAFELNDVWIAEKKEKTVVLFFPSLHKGTIRLEHVFLWGSEETWVPRSLSFRSHTDSQYTFYFEAVE